MHIRDLISLPVKCPDVNKEFERGAFTSNKTGHAFSGIGLDQAHEQVNARVKGDGGAVGLTENPGALRRWMVAGPEISRIVEEFEDLTGFIDEEDSGKHHEQCPSTQKRFFNDVCALVTVMEDMGNPFLEASEDLLTIDSHDIMPEGVVETVKNIQKLGDEQYNKYVAERLVKNDKAISDTISRNSLPLFSRPEKKTSSKDRMKVAQLKNDCSLFARLYIGCQTRDGDLNEFFKHENQESPPSLSEFGKMRTGKKADLVSCLESKAPSHVASPKVDMKVLDGAAVVHFLSTGEARTFEEYAKMVFCSYVTTQLEGTDRIDVVWDVYRGDSLKQGTRGRRGTGVRRRVSGAVKLPGNWPNFLKNEENKDELFKYLAQQIVQKNIEGKVIVTTIGESVLSSADLYTGGLEPCTQEEADTRMMLHVLNGGQQGHRRIMIRTVDTDVVVLSVAHFQKMNLQQLWIAFGTGKEYRYIAIHEIAASISPQMGNGLLFFHALSGCDTTSFFANNGKKSAWQTWQVFPEVTDSFCHLSSEPANELPYDVIQTVERFVILMYSRTSDSYDINETRMTLFTKMSRSIDHIPPTRAALEEHVRRAAYQAGYVWALPVGMVER